MIAGPFERGGYPVWEDRRGDVEVRFVGKGPAGGRDEILARIGEPDLPVAWAKQIHSAHVFPVASPGECGEGDALIADRPGLALSVVTADCVPVLLAGPPGDDRIAAVHAGWRGIASGVIPATLAALGNPTGWTAWIGPLIGPCCYEVGEEVAVQIAAASTPEAVISHPGGRPHLDLLRAARHQLTAAGVADVTALTLCTRCETATLSSYRREGKGGGRNLAFIWRRSGHRKLTYEDYLLIPEDGQRHEIIDGEHCVFPAPWTRHQRLSMRLSLRIGAVVESAALGEIFAAPTDVVLSRHDILQPDLLFISKARAAIVTEKNIQGAPDLVVEILSDGTRRLDEHEKLSRYGMFGVREYWMVDPAADRVHVLRVEGKGLEKVAELSAEAGDVLTTPLLPGLEIPLADLFQ